MKVSFGIVVLGFLIALPASAAPENYAIDTPHSSSNFEVEWLGVNTIPGRFNKTTGKITLDRAAKTGSIEAEIDTTTIDTGFMRRDELLRTEDYFDTTKFPTITFRSSNLRFNGDVLSGADGELTMLGVARPVRLELTSFKCTTHPVNKRELCGAIAKGSIKRTDFGMTRISRTIGEVIQFSLNIVAYKN